MKTMSAMEIWKMKTVEVVQGTTTGSEELEGVNIQIKFIENGVKVGVVTADEDGCVLVCDDFECEEGYWNTYWFDGEEELEFGVTPTYDPSSYYIDDEIIDGILAQTEGFLDYLSEFM
jgi:hypothetical protein